MIACYRSGMFPPQLEEGIRQQARAGIVALIELELIKLESKTVMVGAAAQAE